MYQRLLVPLDGTEHSEQALPYAQMLSQNLQVPVELLLAFIPASAVWVRALLGGRSTPVSEVLEDQEGGSAEREAEQYLEGLAEPLRRQGIDVSTKAVLGDPSAVIAHEAAAAPPSLIVMSTHGRSGLDRWLLGSITDSVVRHTQQPLLLLPLGEDERIGTTKLEVVILPLDGSALAEQVLPHVATLARAFPLRVVPLWVGSRHVQSSHPSAGASGSAGRDASLGTGHWDMEVEVDAYFQEIVTRLGEMGVTQVNPEIRDNHDVAGAILDLAQDTPNSLVALTTHGRSGVGRWVMGSVSDRVVTHTRRPVLLVRAQRT
jgi:nucleotide-binding universal stress UspA family protein